MTREEIGGWHFASSLPLHPQEPESAVGTGNVDAGGSGGDDLARSRLDVREEFGFPYFQECRFIRGGERSVGTWPGDQAADFVPEGSGGGGPIEQAIGTGDFAGVGGLVVELGDGWESTGEEAGDGMDEEGSAQFCQAIVDGLSIIGVEDGRGAGAQDVARVQALIDAHDRYAGLCFAVENGPLDGRRASILGK